MNHKQLLEQLKREGVSKAIAGNGTYDGSNIIFLHWRGKEDHFFGFDESDPHDPNLARLDAWKDRNLD